MSDEDEAPDSELGSLADELSRLFAAVHDVDSHPSADECRYCPLCRVVGLVRTANPEVKDHLAAAGASLLQAATSFLASASAASAADDGIEHINLDSDEHDSDQEDQRTSDEWDLDEGESSR